MNSTHLKQPARRMRNVLPLIAPFALAFLPSAAIAASTTGVPAVPTPNTAPTVAYTITKQLPSQLFGNTYEAYYFTLDVTGFHNLPATESYPDTTINDIYSFGQKTFEAAGGGVLEGSSDENGWTFSDFTLTSPAPLKAIHATDPDTLVFTIIALSPTVDGQPTELFQDQPINLYNSNGTLLDSVVPMAATPEPSSVAGLSIMSLCLGGAALFARKRRAGSISA